MFDFLKKKFQEFQNDDDENKRKKEEEQKIARNKKANIFESSDKIQNIKQDNFKDIQEFGCQKMDESFQNVMNFSMNEQQLNDISVIEPTQRRQIFNNIQKPQQLISSEQIMEQNLSHIEPHFLQKQSQEKLVLYEILRLPKNFHAEQIAQRVEELSDFNQLITKKLLQNAQKNYQYFGQGFQNLNILSDNTNNAYNHVVELRKSINEVKLQYANKSYKIIQLQKRKQKLQSLFQFMGKFQKKFGMIFKKLREIESGQKIQNAHEIIPVIKKAKEEFLKENSIISQFKCLKNMDKFLEERFDQIKVNIRNNLIESYINFEQNDYFFLLKSYYHLEVTYQEAPSIISEYHNFVKQNIKMIMQKSFLHISKESEFMTSPFYLTKPVRLIHQVETDHLIDFFKKLYYDFSNYLYNFHLITRFHENNEQKFKQSENQTFIDYFRRIKFEYLTNRKTLFQKIEVKVSKIVKISQNLLKLNENQFLEFLDYSNKFIQIGEDFSMTQSNQQLQYYNFKQVMFSYKSRFLQKKIYFNKNFDIFYIWSNLSLYRRDYFYLDVDQKALNKHNPFNNCFIKNFVHKKQQFLNRLTNEIIECCKKYFGVFQNNKILNLKTMINSEEWKRLPLSKNYKCQPLIDFIKFYPQNDLSKVSSLVKDEKNLKNIENLSIQEITRRNNALSNFVSGDPFDIKKDKMKPSRISGKVQSKSGKESDDDLMNSKIMDDADLINGHEHVISQSSSQIVINIIAYMNLIDALRPITFEVVLGLMQQFEYFMYSLVHIFSTNDQIKNILKDLDISFLQKHQNSEDNIQNVEVQHETYIQHDQLYQFRQFLIKATDFYSSYDIKLSKLNYIQDVMVTYPIQQALKHDLTERVVACESLEYIFFYMKYIQPYIIKIFYENGQPSLVSIVQQYYDQYSLIIPQIKQYIYNSFIPHLFKFDNIFLNIPNLRWETKEISDMKNIYMERLAYFIKDQKEKLLILGGGCIPKITQQQILTQITQYTFDQLLQSYSKIKKINQLGRKIMSQDFQDFIKEVSKIIDLSQIKIIEFGIAYVQVWNEQIEIIVDFIIESKNTYSLKYLMILFHSSLAGSVLKKPVKRQYIQRIENEYIEFLIEKA